MAKVLLADDSATMQKVVDVVLREEGFDVQSANNGEEALQKVASYQPDLVFAYIKLPGINGYELTKQIKASSNIPVVLLAGAFEPVDDALMQECGADNSLVKPFQTEDLLAIIKKLIPDADTSVVAPAAEEDDDIVFDMSGEDDEVVEAEVVEADVEPEIVTEAAGGDPFAAGGVGAQAAAAPVEAEIMEAEVMEAEVVEAEIVEAEVVEAEVVEAEVVEATVVEAAPAAAMPAVEMPSADELSAIFMRTAEEKIIEAIKGADIRNAVVALLEPRINESLNAMLEEAMPVLMQKLLKEMIEGSLSMLNKELENIMWETVPELAESIIKKEIDKIKSTG